MNAIELLSTLESQGLRLSLDGAGGLRCRGDKTKVGAILPSLKAHKPELLRLLAGKPPIPPNSADPDHGTDYDQETLARAIAMLDAGHRLSVDSGRLVTLPKIGEGDSVAIDPDQGGPVARLWNCLDANGLEFEAHFIDRIPEAEARRLTPEAVTMEPVFPTLTHSEAQNGAIQGEPPPTYHPNLQRADMAVHGGGIPLVVCGECQHFQRDRIGDGTGIGSCPTVNPPGLLWPGTERHCAKFAAIPTTGTSTSPAVMTPPKPDTGIKTDREATR